jgi:hypothetical protein
MTVVKNAQEHIEVHCPVCRHQELLIHGWQGTPWADGLTPPLPLP